MYNHQKIEQKWQSFWQENNTFAAEDNTTKKKYYALDMFPYPSGQGLHVGHPEGYTATDIMSRYKRANGFNVLHPMGWDAFGLPAEQYAMKTGNNPADFTDKNIDHFRDQIKALGFSYDWQREINTSQPEYYRWTQWIFEKLYEKGLAYESESLVNWDPIDGVVLANEEVIGGRSERSGNLVEKKSLKQWVLKITAYADRLIDDLDDLDWPEAIKEQQRNWIGRSVGASVLFNVDGNQGKQIEVFTTRPDTLFGVSYLVLSPENPLVDTLTTQEQQQNVIAFKKELAAKSDLQRTDLNKDKSGVALGSFAINPVNGKKIPIWIGDYVLNSYGTGAVMAVPAHDQRDFDFASKYNLDIQSVIETDNSELPFVKDGVHINSDFLNGLKKNEAIQKIIEWLENNESGKKQVNYRLRDWIFSRQRYWGEPIPVIHWEDGSLSLVPEEELPLLLPKTDKITPSSNGESPLSNISEWLKVDGEKYGKPGQTGRRETNTMPQWAGSSWYFLRYIDPKNNQQIADKKLVDYWMNVDLYIGGAEHAVLHLLYARFWHKVLFDLGIVDSKEPFQKLVNQGMILGENHEKMSKSKGNVVNPDDIVEEYGADTLRVYEMFMGPLEQSKPWSTESLSGSRRWLDRIYRLVFDEQGQLSKYVVEENVSELDENLAKTIKKVTEDIERMSFNTAISQMQIFVNEVYKVGKISKEQMRSFVQLLAPFAPHLSEELWEVLANQPGISYVKWPTFDESKINETNVELPIQINGKVKMKKKFSIDIDQQVVIDTLLKDEHFIELLQGKEIKKTIVVPNKIVNVIVG